MTASSEEGVEFHSMNIQTAVGSLSYEIVQSSQGQSVMLAGARVLEFEESDSGYSTVRHWAFSHTL